MKTATVTTVSAVQRIFQFVALLCLLCLGGIGLASAATPAGTVITNQASATYLDASGQTVLVTSNIVETVVEQVAGIELTQDQSIPAIVGQTVRFNHRLTNTGNGDDQYGLLWSNLGGDDIDLTNLAIYADLNEDGIPDSDQIIDRTPPLAAGGSFSFVVEAMVPPSALALNTALLEVNAQSRFEQTLLATNTDQVNVTDDAVIDIAKSISQSQGLAPSGPYKIRIDYSNIGSGTAAGVVLIDALPEGMIYVPGSGLWSESTDALTDTDPNDPHTGTQGNIRWCAYDQSCVNLPEANSDPDADSTNQVTAIVSVISPGVSGFIEFDVMIAGGQPASTLINRAEVEYPVAGGGDQRIDSNDVSFSILASAGVVANGSTATSINGMNEPVFVNSAAQGGTVSFDNIIWNTGNSVDVFNIVVDTASSSFPIGTTYLLLKADGATPLTDTDNDGSVDTGPLNPGEFSVVVTRLTLAPGVSGNNSGFGFDIEKSAISAKDRPEVPQP